MTKQFYHDNIAYYGSFQPPICLRFITTRFVVLEKKRIFPIMFLIKRRFYSFNVHLFVTLLELIVNYVVTPASIHNRQVAEGLLKKE